MRTMIRGIGKGWDEMNLLKETEGIMIDFGYSPEDVAWVGEPGRWATSWSDFAANAKDYDYDDRDEVADVNIDLIIMMRSGEWLHRLMSEHSEHWVVERPPNKGGMTPPDDFASEKSRAFSGI